MNRVIKVAAVLSAVVLAGCAQSYPSASPSTPAATPASASATTEPTVTAGSCTDVASRMTPAEQAGELILIGLGTAPDATIKATLSGAHVGGVVLTGPFNTGVAGVKAITQQLAAIDPNILVATSQEGGAAQALSGTGFDTIPAAADQAKLPAAELRTKWSAWGRQLVQAGVHLNLAPVVDVVPASAAATSVVAARSYGADPQAVATAVTAVVSGLADAGIAASARNAPSLGTAAGAVPMDATLTADAVLGDVPLRATINAGAAALIVPAASFTAIDPSALAVYSPTVMALVGDELRFPGVIISDDLAGAASAPVPAAQRALIFLKAGGDLAYTSDPALAAELARGLTDAAASDPTVEARLLQSATNVLELKAKVGLAHCEVVKG